MIWENLLKIEFPVGTDFIEADERKIAMTAMMSGKNKDSVEDTQMISAYLYAAGQEILQRCYPFSIPDNAYVPNRYITLQCQIAAYMIGKRGAEGQKSHMENGVSRTYESGGVPESFLSQITPMGMVF